MYLFGIEETTLIYLAIPSMWRVPVQVEDVQWMAMFILLQIISLDRVLKCGFTR